MKITLRTDTKNTSFSVEGYRDQDDFMKKFEDEVKPALYFLGVPNGSDKKKQ